MNIMKSNGFTLVELIIVIVVLGILAGIGVVGYGNIQERTRSSKVAAAIDAYVKAFEQYKQQSRAYPLPSDKATTASSCLGLTSEFPATARFGANVCETSRSDSISADLNSKLQPLLQTMPNANLQEVEYETGKFARGILYSPANQHLWYVMSGNKDCPRGTKTSAMSGAASICTVSLL